MATGNMFMDGLNNDQDDDDGDNTPDPQAFYKGLSDAAEQFEADDGDSDTFYSALGDAATQFELKHGTEDEEEEGNEESAPSGAGSSTNAEAAFRQLLNRARLRAMTTKGWVPGLSRPILPIMTPSPGAVHNPGPGEGPLLIPWVHSMDDVTFALHVQLRHPALLRTGDASYSRVAHERAHANCPSGWFAHVHKEPTD